MGKNCCRCRREGENTHEHENPNTTHTVARTHIQSRVASHSKQHARNEQQTRSRATTPPDAMNGSPDRDSGTFVPPNPCQPGILNLFLDEKTADVAFEVDGIETFYAHKLVLLASAPHLAEICEGTGKMMACVPISGVDPDLFRHMLHYLYGGAVPEEVLIKRSKDIIDLADRYGVGNLKVVAEVWYVQLTPITSSNFVDNLHFSDAKKCALLKEKVMGFIVNNEVEALVELSKQDVPQSESMLTDVMTAIVRKNHETRTVVGHPCEFGEEHDWEYLLLNTISINDLRAELSKRGLSFDGTREMLVSSILKWYQTAEVVVTGAGTPEVNGTYTRAEDFFEGAPVYKKSATYNGKEVELRLQRWCSFEAWYISIINEDNDLSDGDDDIDFYSCSIEYGDRIVSVPPEEGWRVWDADHGAEPAPQLCFVAANHAKDNE